MVEQFKTVHCSVVSLTNVISTATCIVEYVPLVIVGIAQNSNKMVYMVGSVLKCIFSRVFTNDELISEMFLPHQVCHKM